jgi:hypothetical protein
MNTPSCTHVLRLDEDRIASTGYVPAIVAAALGRHHVARSQAGALPTRTDTDHAARAARLAVVSERSARWWDVLSRWVYSPAGYPIPLVFGAAVLAAAASERDDARFWREAAADWTARAIGEPTSDAAGALSNHHELGIAS